MGGLSACSTGFVVGAVIGAILLDAAPPACPAGRRIFRRRIPIDVERFDLGAQEVIGAGGAQLGQPRGIGAVDEGQDVVVILYRADEAIPPRRHRRFPLRDHAAQFRQQFDQERLTLLLGRISVFRAAESPRALVLFSEIARRFFD